MCSIVRKWSYRSYELDQCSRIDIELRMKQKVLVFVMEELKQRIAVKTYGQRINQFRENRPLETDNKNVL